jgi:hypothetical protein
VNSNEPPTPEPEEKKALIRRAFDWALTVDPEGAAEHVAKLREKHPTDSPDKLARRLIKTARWWAVGAGVTTGLPSNPWIAVPAAVAGVGAVLRTEMVLASRIALIYDPGFLSDPDAPYELLAPIFGRGAVSEFMRNIAAGTGQSVSRGAVKQALSTSTLAKFKNTMFKAFVKRVAEKSVFGKSIPIVGGVISGTWNYLELQVVGKRVISYFEQGLIGETGENQ